MGTYQDNGFRDTERCCTCHNTACDCSDTAWTWIDGLQRPWWHDGLGRSFQYGLPVRLERTWRTRQRDEVKDVTSMFHLCIRLRAQSSIATCRPSTTRVADTCKAPTTLY